MIRMGKSTVTYGLINLFRATDASGNAITSDNLALTVTDLNDNTPTFGANLYSKTMKTTDATGTTNDIHHK